MGIIDFFKSLRDSDELADFLKKAVKDAGHRAVFYKKLLESDVCALVFGEELESGEQAVQEDSEINIIKMNNGKIPFFSSKSKIFDNGIIKEGVTYISVRGREFLKMVKGETLILNPYSKVSKELVPEEIEEILAGRMPGTDIRPIIIKNRTEFIIGLPAERPKEMIESIKAYCAKTPGVESVYLALFQLRDAKEKPHFLIAVEASGNIAEIFDEMEQAIKPYLNDGDFLDMTPLKGSSFENYFTTIDPIYRK